MTITLYPHCRAHPPTHAHTEFVQRRVEKTYVARVRGRFPAPPPPGSTDLPSLGTGVITADITVATLPHHDPASTTDTSTTWWECRAPIHNALPRLGVNVVDHTLGRPCLTRFRPLAYVAEGDDDGCASNPAGGYTLVECRPVTGRTHQIRVHLQYCGYPIDNDPVYGGPEWWTGGCGWDGEDEAGGGPRPYALMGEDREAKLAAILERLALQYPQDDEECGGDDGDAEEEEDDTAGDVGPSYSRHCSYCRRAARLYAQGATTTPLATRAHNDAGRMMIHLHSWRYAGAGWRAEAPLPAWAANAVSAPR